jgi:hypothetical protein
MPKKQTTKEVVTTPFKTVVQNLPFHNFEHNKKLIGIYKDTVVLGDEEKLDKDDKPTTFTANIFVDMLTGEEKYVQNSYSIHKAITSARNEYHEEITNIVFEIEFMKKTTLKGKPFNEFKIGYCTLEVYESFTA